MWWPQYAQAGGSTALPIQIKGYKLIGGKLVFDQKAADAKLDVSARIAKKAQSKKPRLVSRIKAQSVRDLKDSGL